VEDAGVVRAVVSTDGLRGDLYAAILEVESMTSVAGGAARL